MSDASKKADAAVGVVVDELPEYIRYDGRAASGKVKAGKVEGTFFDDSGVEVFVNNSHPISLVGGKQGHEEIKKGLPEKEAAHKH